MKSYGQFCALARSLDIVGDRWTLLLVRDLLRGPATFGELGRGLPGLATNTLTERLRHLEDHRVVWRTREGRQTTYGLTDRGRGLSDAIHELIRWGSPEMARGVGGDSVRIEWLPIAIEALLGPIDASGRLMFRIGKQALLVDASAGTAWIDDEAEGLAGDEIEIDTTVEGVLALLSGYTTVQELVRSGTARCSSTVDADRVVLAMTSSLGH